MAIKEVVLSLDKGDEAQPFEAQQRLQQRAYENVLSFLETCVRQANEYSQSRNSRTCRQGGDQLLKRIHNAIFVGGGRGAGKTAFMLNLRDAWSEFQQEKGRRDGQVLHFCQPIDPTLLNGKESFLKVVLGLLHEEVRGGTPSGLEEYWRAMEAVAEALESEKSSGDLYGIEEIMAFRNSLGLERRLYRYLEEACKVKGASAFVVLIDDVDMSLEKAYEILEVVRKYMACPLIIPVISGDLDLYKPVVSRAFEKNAGENGKNGSSIDYDGLAEQYLRKVLPTQQRAILLPVAELTEEIDLKVAVGDARVPFDVLYDFASGVLYRGTNGEEGSHRDFRPRSARELVQLMLAIKRGLELTDLPISRATVQSAVDEFVEDPDKLRVFLRAMLDYWRAIHDVVQECRTAADIGILDVRDGRSRGRPLLNIPWLNALEHPKDAAEYDLAAKVRELAALRPDRAGTLEVPAPLKTLMPMPAYEPYDENALFSGKSMSKATGITAVIARLFSSNEYYSSHQTGHLIFFGRAFELVMSNLMGDIRLETLQQILNNPPYHSHFFFFPTRHLDLRIEEEGMSEEADEYPLPEVPNTPVPLKGGDADDSAKALLDHIAKWRSAHQYLHDRPPSAQMVYMAMNKAFNHFNILKTSLTKDIRAPRINGDSLSVLRNRAQLIIANSVASFEKREGRVVKQNIALGKGDSNFNNDNSFTINIKPLLSADSLTRAVYEHPLFTVALDDVDMTVTGISARQQRTQATSDSPTGGAKGAASKVLKSALGQHYDSVLDWESSKDKNKLFANIVNAMKNNEDRLSAHKPVLRHQYDQGEGTISYISGLAEDLGKAAELEALLRDA